MSDDRTPENETNPPRSNEQRVAHRFAEMRRLVCLNKWKSRVTRQVWHFLLKLLDSEFPVSKGTMLSETQKAEIMAVLRPGDLLLESNSCYPLWQLAALLSTGSIWMHGAVFTGNGFVIDAGSEPLVAKIPLARFLDTTDIAVYRPFYKSSDDAAQMCSFLFQQLGRPFNVTFDTDSEQSFYCMQLIARGLSHLSHPIHLPRSPMFGILCCKQVVSPRSAAQHNQIECLWTSNPSLARDLAAHRFLLSITTLGIVCGCLTGSPGGILIGAVIGLASAHRLQSVLHRRRENHS